MSSARDARFGHWRSQPADDGDNNTDDSPKTATTPRPASPPSSSSFYPSSKNRTTNGTSPLPNSPTPNRDYAHLSTAGGRKESLSRFTPISWSDDERSNSPDVAFILPSAVALSHQNGQDSPVLDAARKSNLSPFKPASLSDNESELSSRPVSPISSPPTPLPTANPFADISERHEPVTVQFVRPATPEDVLPRQQADFDCYSNFNSKAAELAKPKAASQEKVSRVLSTMKQRYKEIGVFLAIFLSALTAFGVG